MSDKGFTDDEVRDAIFVQGHRELIEPLAWAASEYLKAKSVIENIAQKSPAVLCSDPPKDFAQYTAREYLVSLKKVK